MTAIHYPEPEAPPRLERPVMVGALEEPTRPWHRRWRVVVAASVAAVVLVAAGVTWSSVVSSRPVANPDGFAELYVRAYLTEAGEGAEAALTPFLGYEPRLDGMVPGSHYVAGTAVIETTSDDDQLSVVVAVEQLGSVAGGYRTQGLRYYRVDLTRSGTGWIAKGLPAVVGAPATGVAAESRVSLAAPEPGPLTAAIEEYLAWLLTGTQGAYTGPRPTPPPFVSVGVTAVSPIEDGEMSAIVEAVDAAGRTSALQYRLSAEHAEGRWLVTLAP